VVAQVVVVRQKVVVETPKACVFNGIVRFSVLKLLSINTVQQSIEAELYIEVTLEGQREAIPADFDLPLGFLNAQVSSQTPVCPVPADLPHAGAQ
jgi:hypothetical protein